MSAEIIGYRDETGVVSVYRTAYGAVALCVECPDAERLTLVLPSVAELRNDLSEWMDYRARLKCGVCGESIDSSEYHYPAECRERKT